MRRLLLLLSVSALLPAALACREKTVIDCRQLAATVTDKALTFIDRGHYTGSCLYAGMADLEDPRVVEIVSDLVSGKTSAAGGSLICYQVGGQAGAWLAWKGHNEFKAAVAANAADMWEHQYRTTDNLMTGNRQQDRFRDCVWIDLAFAVTPYFLYAGLAEDNEAYVDYAAWYTLQLYKIFHDPATGLVFQARSFGDLADGELSADNWSRGQGWLSVGLAALLRDYPADGPRRAEIESVSRDFYTAILRYQDADGLWHQEVSAPSSFVETSGSGLILAGIGQAIESGILPEERITDFMRGLRGLMAYVDPDGSIGHTCQGTLAPGAAQKADYSARHWYFNEPHAFGPVVLALSQAVRLGVNRFSVPFKLGYKNDIDRPRCYVKYAENRVGDIAWENDFTGYRIYSQLIEKKNHAFSGVDMWPKSVDYSIIDKWYDLNAQGEYYHIDRGEGCDFYTMGTARGTGGTGVWANGKLWTSKVYSSYEILDNEPSHIAFKLEYEPYLAGEVTVKETKRIDFVPGTPFYRITSVVSSSDGNPVVYAVGISEFGNGKVVADVKGGKFWVAERIAAPNVRYNGRLAGAPDTEIFGAAFANPLAVDDIVQQGKDVLLLVNVPSGESVTVYAGALWDQQLAWGRQQINEPFVASLVEETSWNELNEMYK